MRLISTCVYTIWYAFSWESERYDARKVSTVQYLSADVKRVIDTNWKPPGRLITAV